MTELDQNALMAFTGQVAGQITGAVTTAMIVIGDGLGLYQRMASGEPFTPAGLAAATGTHERFVREWLAQQAAAGLVTYDASAGTFTLPAEGAAVLAGDDSPVALAAAALMPAGVFRGIDKLMHAFRTGTGVAWGDQDELIFVGAERFFGVAYRNYLTTEWIPALDGVEQKLAGGARVADVGTGHGTPLLLLAEAYPASRFVGYDAHPRSVEVATRRAGEAGVADRVRFEVSDAVRYADSGYDLICFFDALHDLGDPVAAAAHARHALAPGGTLLVVEPRAAGDLATNIAENPVAAMQYGASTALCVAHSLSEPVGLSLGAQAGEARLRGVLTEAGFGDIRRAAETPFNIVLEARPNG